MNNRLAMALAVAGGYVLGRTKKGRLALGVGGMVLGKRLNIGPQALARLAGEQLLNNPQLKEVGDQVRQDLRGVGKAATGAVVNRRIDSLADALHQRTLDVQDQLSGAAPRPDRKLRADEAGEADEAEGGAEDRGERAEGEDEEREDRERRRPAARARKTGGKTAAKTAKTARGTAPGKPPAPKKRTTAKSPTKKSTAARGGAGRPKGGEGRG